MRNKRRGIEILLAVMLLMLCGCGSMGSAGKREESQKLQIVTTIFPPCDFARQVGREYVEVTMLLKPGMESHSYEPTPADIVKIMNCDLFLYAGGESDVWVEQLFAGSDQAPESYALLDWVEPLEEETVTGMQVKEHKHGHDHEENVPEAVELEEEEYDEHVWTSPKNAMVIVDQIRHVLAQKDPAHGEAFVENADSYIARLKELDDAFCDVVEQSPGRTLVFGDRFPLLYFVKTYGLAYYAAFPGCSMETEPSAETIAFLTKKVRAEEIPVIFYLEMSNGKIAEAIAETTGAKTAVFYSGHSITAQDLSAGEDYLSLMWRNVESLKEALGE